ncbi:MAG TPA: hypothetical protein VLG10_12700 [Methylomirabilota bacterium]|nr:hypothetical protein [Methylomirabilota bacterium]
MDTRDEGTEAEPREVAPLTERIRVSGLDQQSAEALRLAVTRLAKQYGLEARAEVSEEPPPAPE